MAEEGAAATAIEALPPLQRTDADQLYHLDEMPIGEIAKMTGVAEGTIKSHLFRGCGIVEPRIRSTGMSTTENRID